MLREENERGWKLNEEEAEGKILPSANKLFLKVQHALYHACIIRYTCMIQYMQACTVSSCALPQHCAYLLDLLQENAVA